MASCSNSVNDSPLEAPPHVPAAAALARHFPFATQVRPVIADLLRQAADAYAQVHLAETILWSAQAIDPACLPVYFSLYKFYFTNARLDRAEQVARQALKVAASQGGFSADWRQLHIGSADWNNRIGAQHFYLFSLKALAFICLRQRRPTESRDILAKLAELDAQDSVGASVIRELLQGIQLP